jgi:hypothetical protein
MMRISLQTINLVGMHGGCHCGTEVDFFTYHVLIWQGCTQQKEKQDPPTCTCISTCGLPWRSQVCVSSSCVVEKICPEPSASLQWYILIC